MTNGVVTPTQLLAVLGKTPCSTDVFSKTRVQAGGVQAGAAKMYSQKQRVSTSQLLWSVHESVALVCRGITVSACIMASVVSACVMASVRCPHASLCIGEWGSCYAGSWAAAMQVPRKRISPTNLDTNLTVQQRH